MSQHTYILGGGVPGLAAGLASGLTVFDALTGKRVFKSTIKGLLQKEAIDAR